jgi:monoamine oxidase
MSDTARPETVYDVAVIGAGFAGLAAARAVATKGRTAVVFEGRDRVGGRVWTRATPDGAVPLELGAEFVHGHPAATARLAHEVGVPLVPGAEQHLATSDTPGAPLQPVESPFEGARSLVRHANELGLGDLSVAAYLGRFGRAPADAEHVRWTRWLVEGFDAADPARASVRAIAEEWDGGASAGTPLARPTGGYEPLLRGLVRALPSSRAHLRLSAVVREITWGSGAVAVAGISPAGPFRVGARTAVVTLPLGVLQAAPDEAAGVRFTPELPPATRGAIAGLAMGPVCKVLLWCRSPFWESVQGGRYRDAAFFHAPEEPVPTFWTALPLRAPLLTAWAGGPAASRLTQRGQAGAVRAALESAARIFGPDADPANELVAAYVHDWTADPFARGAYSYVVTGATTARATLAAPIRDTLFFAGEATQASAEAGTVAGALASGERAAAEVVRALSKARLPTG